MELSTVQRCEWMTNDNITLSCPTLSYSITDSYCGWLIYFLISAQIELAILGFISKSIDRMITRILAQWEGLSVGSFTVYFLKSKIVFHDIKYVTSDYTATAPDGWLMFRWWKFFTQMVSERRGYGVGWHVLLRLPLPLPPGRSTDRYDDLWKSQARLVIKLNQVELLMNSECPDLSTLRHFFGLGPATIRPNETADSENQEIRDAGKSTASLWKRWRDLISVTKVYITSGCVKFGSRDAQETPTIDFEKVNLVHMTKREASSSDRFVNLVQYKANNIKGHYGTLPRNKDLKGAAVTLQKLAFTSQFISDVDLAHAILKELTLNDKIVFHEMSYMNDDCIVTAQDGWLLCKRWESNKPIVSEDNLLRTDPQLSVKLNGFFFSMMKGCPDFRQWFVREPAFNPPTESDRRGSEDENTHDAEDLQTSLWKLWRDLIPVTKVEISTGIVFEKFFACIFGMSSPQIHFDEAHLVHVTKPETSNLDRYTNIVEFKAKNVEYRNGRSWSLNEEIVVNLKQLAFTSQFLSDVDFAHPVLKKFKLTPNDKITLSSILYRTNDYTVNVKDGWLLFAWHESRVLTFAGDSLPPSNTLLFVNFNGFDLCMNKGCPVFSGLPEMFGFRSGTPLAIGSNENGSSSTEFFSTSTGEFLASLWEVWRDFIPVTKVDISSGDLKLTDPETQKASLSIHFEKAHLVYSTKPASSQITRGSSHSNRFMNNVECKLENVKSCYDFSYLMHRFLPTGKVDITLKHVVVKCQSISIADLAHTTLKEFKMTSKEPAHFTFDISWLFNWSLNGLVNVIFKRRFIAMVEGKIQLRYGLEPPSMSRPSERVEYNSYVSFHSLDYDERNSYALLEALLKQILQFSGATTQRY